MLLPVDHGCATTGNTVLGCGELLLTTGLDGNQRADCVTEQMKSING